MLIRPWGAQAGVRFCNHMQQNQVSLLFDSCVLTLMAVSLIATFSFPFGCFVVDINQLKLNVLIIMQLRKRTPNKFIAETSRTVLAYKTWFCLFSVYRNRFMMF